MAPFQIILLLILVGTPEAFPEIASGSTAKIPTAQLLVAFWLTHLILFLCVWPRVRQLTRALHQPSVSGALATAHLDRLLWWARWSTIAATAIFLFGTHLPGSLRHALAGTQVLKHIPHLLDFFLLAPALLAWVGFWILSYGFDHASRERTFPYRLAGGLPTHAMPTLSQYLSLQIRHNFWVFLPILVHSVITMAATAVSPWIPYAVEIAEPLGIVAVLCMLPWLLVRVWSTVPLKGALRTKLDAVAAKYRLRFRNILLWKTHNVVTNAAILGWVPFSRYFLMTDALLESLSDNQIEAVFAHEVGHGVHRHILWYLASVMGTLALAGGLAIFWTTSLPPAVAHFAGSDDVTASVISMGVFMLFMGVCFPMISHRFEHQADWFASRHMGSALPAASPRPEVPTAQEPLAAEATPVEALTLEEYVAGAYPHAAASLSPAPSVAAGFSSAASPAPAAKLLPTQRGAEVFISALDTLLEGSHRSRSRRGWMHPSPNDRISLLRRLAADPRAAALFDRRMRTTRLMIAAFFIAGVATITAGILHEKKLANAQNATPPAATQPAPDPHARPTRVLTTAT